MLNEQEQRKILRNIFDAALEAVAPDGAVNRFVKLNGDILCVDGREYDIKGKKILVLGAGKGVAPMAQAVENILGSRINAGLVVTKYHHALPLKYIKILEAAHPVPDAAGVIATQAILDMAEKAQEDTLVICLFTGGASALTPSPAKGLSLEHVQEVTSLLLQSGANIQQINALRKHLSSFSGGQLARKAAPAMVLSLIVSDVIGDDLDVIASGPTASDSSTYEQCLEIIDKFSLHTRLPAAVLERLEQGRQGIIMETPKHDDSLFENVHNVLVATNAEALNAAANFAKKQGFSVYVMPASMQGEAREQAFSLLKLSKEMQNSNELPLCILAGGETTVTIQGEGKGGRNQEMALCACLALDKTDNISCLFAGTDGTDGPTDAAGGFAFAGSAARLGAKCDAKDMLAQNNSYEALQLSGDLLITGPTRTNVMDLAVILVVA